MTPPEEQRAAELVAENTRKADEAARIAREAAITAAKAEAVEAERVRAAEVRSLLVKFALDPDAENVRGLLAKPVAEVNAGILDILAKRSEETSISSVVVPLGQQGEREKRLERATFSILERTGMLDAYAKAEGKQVRECDPGEFRGFRVVDFARDFLEDAGVKTRGLSYEEMIGRAHVTDGKFAHMRLQLDGSRSIITQSTSDLAVLLENVMHKTVRATPPPLANVWRMFSKVGSVTDFRDWPIYEMGSLSILDEVSETEEYKNKPLTDGVKFLRRVLTYGNIVNWSRQMAINDDVGYLTGTTERLTQAYYRTIESLFFAVINQNAGLGPTLPDGLTLFHASHGNYQASGTAPTTATLDADRVAMGSQQDKDGNDYLDVRPDRVLVSLAKEGALRQVIASEFDMTQTVANQAPNYVRNFIAPGNIVGSPRIGGATRRYYFANPNEFPVIEVDFLNGKQTPNVATKDAWRQDGAEMKISSDVGVSAVGFRGAYLNLGA